MNPMKSKVESKNLKTYAINVFCLFFVIGGIINSYPKNISFQSTNLRGRETKCQRKGEIVEIKSRGVKRHVIINSTHAGDTPLQVRLQKGDAVK